MQPIKMLNMMSLFRAMDLMHYPLKRRNPHSSDAAPRSRARQLGAAITRKRVHVDR